MKIQPVKLTTEEKLLLSGSGLNLDTDDLAEMDVLISAVTNWDYFTNIVLLNSIGPLLYINLSSAKNKHLIPAKTLMMFKQTYMMLLSRNMILYDHFKNAVCAFSEKGISVIGLKGIFLAEKIYKDIGLRQLSDIDILVRKEDVMQCRDILTGLGYQTKTRIKSEFIKSTYDIKHLPPLVMKGVSIELHTKIHTDSFDFNISMDDFWSRASATTISETPCLQLNPVDLIIHQCIHLDVHIHSGKIRFYYICDIAAIIKHYQKEIDWQLLVTLTEKYNCKKIVFSYLYLCNKYLKTKVPEYILNIAKEEFDPLTEKLFLLNVKANEKVISNELENSNISNLQKVKGFRKKIRYLTDDIFPSKKFMYSRYRVKNKYLVYFYYLIRIKTGFFSFFKHFLFGKKK